MRIGIDISQISYEGTGVGRFTRGLTEAILTSSGTHGWVFFHSSLRRGLDEDIKKRIIKKGHTLKKWPVPQKILSVLWNDMHTMSIDTILGELDWFISSDWTEPPAHTKKATIVHDLTFKRYPETVESGVRKTQKSRMKWVVKESSLIFADSNATKKDLKEYYSLSESKTVVNYPGVEMVKPSSKKIPGLSRPFILTVGKLEPRKNINRLIEAYEKWGNPEVDLVIVGQKGWGDVTKKQSKSIHFLGHVSDEELASLYLMCLFFIFPSIWEGFGYPLVEAMSMGAPTATSNTSSLKEIGEGASLFFDPHSTESIIQAMDRLATDSRLRNELKEKGLKKAKEFTWKRYIEKMIRELEVRS